MATMRAAHRQARAVQGVHQLRALGARALEADFGAPGLVVGKVAAGGDFPVEVLPRQPHLDVIGLGRGEAHVAGAQHDDPVGQAQLLKDRLGVLEQELQLLVGGFRRGEFHQLHLVELVLADQPPDILTVGAGLGAEAGGVGGVVDGQAFSAEDFAPVDVGHRHLGGGHQIVVACPRA